MSTATKTNRSMSDLRKLARERVRERGAHIEPNTEPEPNRALLLRIDALECDADLAEVTFEDKRDAFRQGMDMAQALRSSPKTVGFHAQKIIEHMEAGIPTTEADEAKLAELAELFEVWSETAMPFLTEYRERNPDVAQAR
jgi:hypothetical protein